MDEPEYPDASVAGVWGDAEPAPTEPQDESFGVEETARYDRGGLLGVGGMGRVVSARDRRLDRDVALKEPLPETGPAGARQLAREARITARLEHPGSVAVHDAGTDATGRPWYTMPVMRGRTLRSVLDGADPETRVATLRRVLAACQAVAFAHSRRVVHRDLKPGNILLGEFGETLVADWGLALPLDEDDDLSGSSVGTPMWMSPEQERGERATTRSDVWSLGAILGAVLAAGEAPEAAAIVRRATADDPRDRYSDAGELADDLARYLDGRRVRAHEYTAGQLLSRLVRLWRAPLIVAALAGLLIAAAVGVGIQREGEQRDRAQANLAQALIQQARTAEKEDRRAEAEVLAAEALAIRDSPQARGVLVGYSGFPRPRREALPGLPADCDGRWVLPDGLRICRRGTLLEAHRAGREAPLWSREANRAHVVVTAEGDALLGSDLTTTLLDPESGADRRLISDAFYGQYAARGRDGLVAIWRGPDFMLLDLETGARSTTSGCAGTVIGAAFRGEVLSVLCANLDMIHRAATVAEEYEPLGVIPLTLPGGAIAFTRLDDRRVLVGGTAGTISVLAADTGELLASRRVADHPIPEVLVEPEGDRIAVRTEQGQVVVWDADGLAVVRLPVHGVQDIAWSPDGALLLAGPRAETWHLDDDRDPRRISTFAGLSTVRRSPDGRSVVAVRGDGLLTVWTPGEGVRVLPAFDSVVKDARFTPDGREIVAVAASSEHSVLVDVERGTRRPATTGSHRRRVGVAADGSTLSLAWGEFFSVAPAPDGPMSPLTVDGWPYWDLATSDDLTLTAVMGAGPRVHVGTLVKGVWSELWSAGVEGGLGVAVQDGGRVAVGTNRGVVLLEAGGEERRLLEAPATRAAQPAISPSGRWGAAGDLAGSVWIWDTEADGGAGRLRAELTAHDGRVSGILFRTEDELVTGGWDATVRRWDLSRLDRDPSPAEVSAAWDTTLEQVLARPY